MSNDTDFGDIRPLISHENDPGGPTDDTLLEGHLKSVGTRAVDMVAGPDVEDDFLRAVALCGRLHDFGKATPAFQQYVREDITYTGPQWKRYHARLGALATFYALKKAEVSEQIQLAGFLAVARHHGSVPNLLSYIEEKVIAYERQNGTVVAQAEAIDEVWPDAADKLLRAATDEFIEWRSLYAALVNEQELLSQIGDTLKIEYLDTSEISQSAVDDTTYDKFYRLWSVLTLADKSHAAGIQPAKLAPLSLASPPLRPLTEHIKRVQASTYGEESLKAKLNCARETARKEAHARLYEIDGIPSATGQNDPQQDAPDVLTIPLPTGLGKTFTGLSVGLDLQDRNQRTESSSAPSPIVYALPYTSIIEQTRNHIENPRLWNANPHSRRFTVDHHLSETRTEVFDEDPLIEELAEETDDEMQYRDPAALLGETWRSGLVLTTFVKLFESLARPTSNTAMKGVSLSNAVVILDEPQALPMRWWPAVERICRLLTDELGATIISMTATQPPLFNADDIETASLVPSTSSYQERFERVSYNIDESVWDYGAPDRNSPGPLSYTDAANRVTDSLSETDGSVLAVCNTIASARTLYEQVVRGLGEPIRLGERIKAKLRTWTPESSKHLRDPDKVIERTRRALESDTEGDTGLSGAAIAPSPTELVAEILDDLELDTMEPRIPVVTCLTGEHRPYDKRILIELIEKLATSERPLIVVSTQVIEAGVDVSFRTVYRDHAPIPSLVQSAGRCNRSFEWGEGGGEVTFWQLAGNESGLLPARIYERRQLKNHLEIVSEVLRDICETPQSVSEQTIAVNAVEAYYDVLSENGVGDQNLVKWIDEFRGADLATERLIEDIETVDLIAPQTIRERTVAMAVRKAFEQEQLSVGYHLLELLQDCRVSAKPRTDAFSQATQPIAPDIDQLENVVSPVSMNGELYTPEYGVGGTTLK